MNLNKPAKIILGILTFLPLLFAISILGLLVFNIFSMFYSQGPAMPMMLFSYLSYLLPYVFFIILLALGLFVFYIVHIIQNSMLDNEKRILWIAIVLTGYGIALPVYWYIHIWKNCSPEKPETNNRTEDYYGPGTQP